MKRVLITGATGTIGSAIAKILAKHSYSIIVGGRSQLKINAVIKQLQQINPEIRIEGWLADLRSKNSIQKAIDSLQDQIDILINNASETPVHKIITEEGLECQFAVNILGYHRMIAYLKDRISSHGRIINVASYWAGNLDIEDLQFEKRRYDNHSAYRQSKQAERMLTLAWAHILKNKVTVNACHPGDANSKLSNDLGFGGFETPEQAADTPSYLAYSEEVHHITGKYFEHRKVVLEPFAKNPDLIWKLYEICNQYL